MSTVSRPVAVTLEQFRGFVRQRAFGRHIEPCRIYQADYPGPDKQEIARVLVAAQVMLVGLTPANTSSFKAIGMCEHNLVDTSTFRVFSSLFDLPARNVFLAHYRDSREMTVRLPISLGTESDIGKHFDKLKGTSRRYQFTNPAGLFWENDAPVLTPARILNRETVQWEAYLKAFTEAVNKHFYDRYETGVYSGTKEFLGYSLPYLFDEDVTKRFGWLAQMLGS
ncbi:MAG: hypothetical protein WC527_00615 [Candidatus Margulisiibacteriota bacterium]